MVGLNRITSAPAVMNGQPCIRGIRLTVRRVLDALATYPDRQELAAEYPELEDEDIRQALAWAVKNLVLAWHWLCAGFVPLFVA